MIQDDLYSHLSNNAGITAITTRIYPILVKQNEDLPAVSYSMDGQTDEKDISGTVQFTVTETTIEAFASGYREVKLLAAAIKTAMETASTAWWQADLGAEADGYESESNAYSVVLTYTITHN